MFFLDKSIILTNFFIPSPSFLLALITNWIWQKLSQSKSPVVRVIRLRSTNALEAAGKSIYVMPDVINDFIYLTYFSHNLFICYFYVYLVQCMWNLYALSLNNFLLINYVCVQQLTLAFIPNVLAKIVGCIH